MKPMLASEADTTKLNFPVVVQSKLDGIRACVVNGKLVSRTLKEIPNREIFDALSKPEFEGLDGEILVGEPTAVDCYRRTSSFVMAKDKTGEPWCYHVFDKWNHPGTFWERYDNAVALVQYYARSELQLAAVPSRNVLTTSALEDYEKLAVQTGHEGVILRDPFAPYKFGRSGKNGPLLKLKRFTDFEAEVLGVYALMHNANTAKTNALGRTERSSHKEGKEARDTLGGLVLRAVNGPWEGVEFRCGTGFDAATRGALWLIAQSEGLEGNVAKVKAFVTGAKDKPRFPVWLGWRDKEDFDA